MSLTRIFPFALLLALAACGSTSPGGHGGACGSGPSGVHSSDPACSSCLQSSCNAEASSAFGPGWAQGSFGGSCAAYIACASTCACDQKCILGCAPDASCQTALMALGTCEETKCSSACKSQSSSSSSGSTGSGMTVVACYKAADFQCTTTTVADSFANTVQMACTQDGGSASATCPSAGALGCCTFGPSEVCYYQGGSTDAATAQMQCMQGGGTWSATP